MRYGSVCSGIESASQAWHALGWKPSWFAEIEPFPSAVLAHHYPDVPNYGDMTQLAGMVDAGSIEVPDVLVGGTPCQAFSVAGMRKGLGDTRGELTIRFVGLADAIDRKKESIIVWENVPGVLSDKGNAFGCFLGALAGEHDALQPPGGRWSRAGCVLGAKRAIAWRVLDAQYFGLAQRRKRVFVVASARKDFDPVQVLFEFDGVRWDIAPTINRERSGEAVAVFDRQRSNMYGNADIASTIAARDYKDVTDIVLQNGKPRRLTPRECERLQGFPDDYTLVPWRNGMAPDGLRYKALGNSKAVDVVRWIGSRIQGVLK